MQAFGVFEGGGAKGLAHVGALKAAEDEKVDFVGVAGTSAGAIIAALVAAGYEADELYDPNPNVTDSLFKIPFLDFFDPNAWQSLEQLKNDAEKSLTGAESLLGLWYALSKYLLRNRDRLKPLATHGGFLSTSVFEDWLNEKLIAKLKAIRPEFVPTGENGRVAFQDLSMPLKIVTADTVRRKIKVFGMPDDATVSVASAVSASTSIPFIFYPRILGDTRLVDGGIVSNFPAWVFDDERERYPPLTPTFGFRLVSKVASSKPSADLTSFSLFDHLSDVYNTSVFGDNSLEKRQVASLHEIPLVVDISPLKFDLNDAEKERVYKAARRDAKEYLRDTYSGPIDGKHVKERLGLVHKAMCGVMNHTGHLRVNVMRPISNDTLQVVYTFNMDGDDDYDDRLQFKRGCGASGDCWLKLTPIVCDLTDAKETYKHLWKMDKYQQRLVRVQLTSLLSVPIFDQKILKKAPTDQETLRRAFLGVLNFDSDDDILKAFAQKEVKEFGEVAASMVAETILRRPSV